MARPWKVVATGLLALLFVGIVPGGVAPLACIVGLLTDGHDNCDGGVAKRDGDDDAGRLAM